MIIFYKTMYYLSITHLSFEGVGPVEYCINVSQKMIVKHNYFGAQVLIFGFMSSYPIRKCWARLRCGYSLFLLGLLLPFVNDDCNESILWLRTMTSENCDTSWSSWIMATKTNAKHQYIQINTNTWVGCTIVTIPDSNGLTYLEDRHPLRVYRLRATCLHPSFKGY